MMTNTNTDTDIYIYGAGLAGCEAAWQAAQLGVSVQLIEMKPHRYSPAHHSPNMAELVCSNSLRSDSVTNAVGLLKEEMRRCDSLIMQAAAVARVPAGSALAVDRDVFSSYVTEKIRQHPKIRVLEREACDIVPGALNIIATGPLTSDAMASYMQHTLGCRGLHFFDAAAPIVDAAGINMDVAYFASRYDKGDADYINCPMNEQQYEAFYQALITAEQAQLKEFDRQSQENLTVFEGCMPVEVMAKRGHDTLLYGPLKPVGLIDPRVGKEAYAVVQLRKENREGTMYNLVGFQTHLTFPEQRRVFRMIPGLEQAEFLRYGVMHRNTYLDSPHFLTSTYAMATNPDVYFAGQMTGVEGYVESAGSGLVAGRSAARRVLGMKTMPFPRETMLGAMAAYVSEGGTGPFVPMNANFGIIPSLPYRVKGGKLAKYEKYAARSLEALDAYLAEINGDTKQNENHY